MGGRDSTIGAFIDGVQEEPETFNVLLVDSDDAVILSAIDHLQLDSKTKIDPDSVHLMVRTIETWMVADAEGLEKVFGKGFNPRALPAASDLESVGKKEIAKSLSAATKQTTRGIYHKITDVTKVLAVIDPAKVRKRCKRCDHLFATLER